MSDQAAGWIGWAFASFFRTPDEVHDWSPASWDRAKDAVATRIANAEQERQEQYAAWRNGQLPYQVAALAAPRNQLPDSRRPVLAWFKVAR